MIPSLIILSAALGIMGVRIAGEATGIIPADVYDQGLLWGFKDFTILFMLIKAYCFAFLISINQLLFLDIMYRRFFADRQEPPQHL